MTLREAATMALKALEEFEPVQYLDDVVAPALRAALAEEEADCLSEKEALDINAMNEAQLVLEVIKETDPGVYDEMIDSALRLIAKALDFKVEQE